jgi:uncharacterized membrane protein YdjX (TVP38/TMEM64 family)
MSERTLRLVRIAVVIFVLAMLLVAQQTGLLAQFADPARARAALNAMGPWGYVAFVVAYALIVWAVRRGRRASESLAPE